MLPQYRTPLVRQNLESLRHHADWRGLGNIAERDALIIAIETLGKPSTCGHDGMKWVLPENEKPVNDLNWQSGRLNVANGATPALHISCDTNARRMTEGNFWKRNDLGANPRVVVAKNTNLALRVRQLHRT